MSRFVRYLEMGCFPAFVGFTSSPTNYAKELRRLKIEPSDLSACADPDNPGRTITFYRTNEPLLCIVSLCRPLARKVKWHLVAGLLAHEATHVKQKVFDYMHEANPSAETEAYLVQSITQFCLREYLEGR